MLDKFISALRGKKTFIVGVLMIALGIMNGDNALILQGLGFVTVREAISYVNVTPSKRRRQ